MTPSSSADTAERANDPDLIRQIVRAVLAEVTPDGYLGPDQLARRWSIDRDTLNKLGLPWIWIARPGEKGQLRRISFQYVLTYERQQRFVQASSS